MRPIETSSVTCGEEGQGEGEGQREREEDRDEGGGERVSFIVGILHHRPTRQCPWETSSQTRPSPAASLREWRV